MTSLVENCRLRVFSSFIRVNTQINKSFYLSVFYSCHIQWLSKVTDFKDRVLILVNFQAWFFKEVVMKGSVSTAAYAEVKTQLCNLIILLSINKRMYIEGIKSSEIYFAC